MEPTPKIDLVLAVEYEVLGITRLSRPDALR
jgi:hypothetical protein